MYIDKVESAHAATFIKLWVRGQFIIQDPIDHI